MILIQIIDIIYKTYSFIIRHKKHIQRYAIEILIIILLSFACYSPKELTQTAVLKSHIMTLENEKDSISYLLKILQKKDSINISILRHRPSLQPIKSNQIVAISTQYGMRTDKTYGMIRFHDGVDFAAQRGTPVYADGDGIISDSGYDNAYGNHIQIDHQNGFSTFYGHLNTRKVEIGQNVMRGDTIGTVGSTGVSTGFHLHYRITYKGTPINPVIFLK